MGPVQTESCVDVVAFIVRNMMLGVGFGILFGLAALWLDVGGLGGLVWRSPDRIVALCLLFGGFAITFGSAVAGTAIMLLPHDAPEDRG